MTKKFVRYPLPEKYVTKKKSNVSTVHNELKITVTGEIKEWCKIWTTGHWFLSTKIVNTKVSLLINFTQAEDAMAFKLIFL